jgi:prepilin-type N-terminal cleavage/methylation domain-containing protein
MKINKGFSLVEVIVAAGILGFALSSLLMFFTNSVALNENARNMTVAMTHAEFVLEEVRNTPYATAITQIDAYNWTWSTPSGIYAKGLSPLNNEMITTTRSNTLPPEVTVTVNWQDAHQRSRSLAFGTIIGGV